MINLIKNPRQKLTFMLLSTDNFASQCTRILAAFTQCMWDPSAPHLANVFCFSCVLLDEPLHCRTVVLLTATRATLGQRCSPLSNSHKFEYLLEPHTQRCIRLVCTVGDNVLRQGQSQHVSGCRQTNIHKWQSPQPTVWWTFQQTAQTSHDA